MKTAIEPLVGEQVVTRIDRKLCLTASLLGAGTRKELAAAFRRVNPTTEFDLQRAHKWLQGRAQPRGRRIYEDLALLVDIGRSADWIAECEVDAFIDEICTRHSVARELLLRRADAFRGGHGDDRHDRELELTGTYACYSHAWSPYFRGRLVRGILSISADGRAQHLSCTYTEWLPIGRLQYAGTLVSAERDLHIRLRAERGSSQMLLWLFEPTPPVSVLGGVMCGTTVMSAAPDLSITRIVGVRLPAPSEMLSTTDAYLPQGASLTGDLAAMGLEVDAPDPVDAALARFLTPVGHDGFDQVSVATYREVVELFDRSWLERGQRLLPPEDEPERTQRQA